MLAMPIAIPRAGERGAQPPRAQADGADAQQICGQQP